MPNWKNAERRLAAFFGAIRAPLSGGNSRHTRSDSLHKELFLSSKHTKSSSLWNLFRKEKEKALKEKKIPVLGICNTGCHGFLIVIHSDDFDRVSELRHVAKFDQIHNQTFDRQLARDARISEALDSE